MTVTVNSLIFQVSHLPMQVRLQLKRRMFVLHPTPQMNIQVSCFCIHFFMTEVITTCTFRFQMMCSKWNVPFFPCSVITGRKQFQRDFDILNALARQRGFTVVEVIGGGHCLFALVEFGLLKTYSPGPQKRS